MSDVRKWLDSIGLGQYAGAFAIHGIEWELLTELDHDVLKDIGVTSAGHRMRILKATQALGHKNAPEAAPSTAEPASDGDTAPGAEAERRLLTVMFCDLVGSTELSQRLDPEDLREIIAACQESWAAAIQRYDGYVARYMGDGVLAYFGYPQAHEDDPERAVQAGLRIVETVGAVPTPKHLGLDNKLAVRVGIATGPVVVGDVIGEGASRESPVVGETPNLAARLQGVAAPDQVVVSSTTRRLLGESFELSDLGAQTLKGMANPVAAWRVLAEVRTETRFAARGGRLTPFVGREAELHLLEDRWNLARGGEGQVVLICGEAGIGKSRLLRAFNERLAGEQYTQLNYQCSPYHRNTALHPVIRHLERLAGLLPNDDGPSRLDKLEAMLDGWSVHPEQAVPLLGEMLTVPFELRYPPPALTPQQRKDGIFTLLIDEIMALARKQPVLLVFEDVHWIDPTTLDLLSQILTYVTESRLLLVLTHRPEWQPSWTDRQGHVTSLSLLRLGHTRVAEMVRALMVSGASDELVRRIAARTNGVPLFVEELTRSLLDVASDGLGGAAERDIPETLQALLQARLDRLGEAKEIAQVGAVIGRQFSRHLMAEVVAQPDAALDAALEKLEQAQLLLRRGSGAATQYSFKHALIQDEAYASLLRRRRQELHARIAGVLEREYTAVTESEPEIVAHHYTEGGLGARAAPYWRKAGDRSVARWAAKEAAKHYQAGLAVTATLPQESERDALELPLLLGQAVAVRMTHGYGAAAAQALDSLERARTLARKLGQTAQHITAVFGIWRHHIWCSGPLKAQPSAEEMFELAVNGSDLVRRGDCHYAKGINAWELGQCAEALPMLETAMSLYELGVHSSLIYKTGHDPRLSGSLTLAWVSWLTGAVDRSLVFADEAMARAEAQGDPFTLLFANLFSPLVYILRREIGPVVVRTQRATQLATRHGFLGWDGPAAFNLGYAEAHAGNAERGCAAMREGANAWTTNGMTTFLPVYECELGFAYLRAGHPDRAGAVAAEALALARSSGDRWWEAEMHRLNGLVALSTMNGESDAQTHFKKALDVARSQGALSLELRAAIELGRFWKSHDNSNEGRKLVSSVYERFEEGFDTPDLRDAKAFLEQFS